MDGNFYLVYSYNSQNIDFAFIYEPSLDERLLGLGATEPLNAELASLIPNNSAKNYSNHLNAKPALYYEGFFEYELFFK